MTKSTSFKAAFAAIATAVSLIMSVGTAFAAVSVGAPMTASVSSDSLTGASVALPAFTLNEGAAGDIQIGTLAWGLPSGFIFDTASIANVATTGTGLTASSTVSFPDTTHFSINITATSTSAGSITVGSTTPLKVKVTSGTPLAGSGNIILTSGNLSGLSTTTTYGILGQVAGAANKLAFTVQPISTVATNTTFSATVAVQDQFGNTATSDNGRNINLSSVLNANTASSSAATLGGTASMNDSSGLATFNNLSYSVAETIKLMASSSPLASAFSNAITVTGTTSTTTPPTPTSTPPTFLRNGVLVIVAGNPTVYMVVNGTLRPFNTPAIFHARGKKFEDIIVISQAQFALLTIGKPVGQSDDDNIPTPPSLTNLPDGSIVKVPGNPTVYLVSGGVLQPFTSLSVFKAHKKSFSQIQTISSTTLASLTLGAPAEFPDGTLLKGSDKTVYVVQGSQLFAIPSVQVFNKHGWSFKNVINLEDNELARHTKGGLED